MDIHKCLSNVLPDRAQIPSPSQLVHAVLIRAPKLGCPNGRGQHHGSVRGFVREPVRPMFCGRESCTIQSEPPADSG